MSWRDVKLLVGLAAAVGFMALVVQAWLAPVLPPAWRPLAWVPVTLSATLLLIHAGSLAVREVQAQRVRRLARAAQPDLPSLTAQRLRRRLYLVHAAFRNAPLSAEREGLRQRLAAAGPGPSTRLPALRLLALEGPQSPAWIILARSLLPLGRTLDGLRCAAEAVRAGLAEFDLLVDLARAEPGPPGSPAALVLAAAEADRLSAQELAGLYAALDAGALPPVLWAVLGREAVRRVHDAEEAARLRERVDALDLGEAELRRWLTDGWAGYDAMQGWRLPPPDPRRPPVWADLVPAAWQPALGLTGASTAVPPRYLDALPVYAVAGRERLSGLADELSQLQRAEADPAYRLDVPAEALAAYLRDRLWPRAVRSRSAVTEALERLAGHKSPQHVATGLELVGQALSEETDTNLVDLRADLERAARRLPEDAAQARALHAAGHAWAPVDPARAWALWEESLARARRLGHAARPVLARLVHTWLQTAGSARGSQALTLAADTALDSGDPDALLAVLQAVAAAPPSRVREGLLRRLGEASSRFDARGRLLLGWISRQPTAFWQAATALWDQPGDTPPRGWAEVMRGVEVGPAELPRLEHPWVWTVPALAELADEGGRPVLEQALEGLRTRAEAGDPGAAGAAVVCAWRLDRLDRRRDHPRARLALDLLRPLPLAALSLPLDLLRCTLAEPAPDWVEALERGLLGRLQRREPGIERVADAADAFIAALYPAHVQARVDAWLDSYRAQVQTWLREI